MIDYGGLKKLSDICQVVVAKSNAVPVLPFGRIRSTLYVSNRFDVNKQPIAFFTTKPHDVGYYLLSEHREDLLYCSFILNSIMGPFFLRGETSSDYTKGTITKKKLDNIQIRQLPERYMKSCNMLELILARLRRLNTEDNDDDTIVVTTSFLEDVRNFIALELYMKPVFESHQVSILDPWTRFVEEKGGDYKLDIIYNVFISFYKSISDPDNEIMDAVKKIRMFIWEQTEIEKE